MIFLKIFAYVVVKGPLNLKNKMYDISASNLQMKTTSISMEAPHKTCMENYACL